MQHKNFKNIDKVTYGRGSFSQLAETVEPIRKENKNYFVYYLRSTIIMVIIVLVVLMKKMIRP